MCERAAPDRVQSDPLYMVRVESNQMTGLPQSLYTRCFLGCFKSLRSVPLCGRGGWKLVMVVLMGEDRGCPAVMVINMNKENN